MSLFVYIVLPALIGGMVQGLAGFGAGVVMMIFIPFQYSVVQSAGMSSAICLVLSSLMCWKYRRFIRLGTLIGPAILYLCVSSASILFAQLINQDVMKVILGVFLVFLSIYFLFFSKNEFEPKGIIAIFCIVISGACDGLFGIGGPLMVVYFLSKTKTKDEYLGTIQCFFFITILYATIFRIVNGILTWHLLGGIGLGMIGVIVGLMIANKIIDRIDAQLMKKITYVVIGLSGLSNMIMGF